MKAEQVRSAQWLSWKRLHMSKTKLAGVAEIASHMAGFAVVATVELQIHDQDKNPLLLTAFVVTTSLLVATTMIAIMLATCILPYLEGVSKMSENVEDVDLSPHDRMSGLIDVSWVFASTASLFLFTLDVILMSWIKFTYYSSVASIVATMIMGPVMITILVFGFIFYRSIVKQQYLISTVRFRELELMHRDMKKIDSALPPTIVISQELSPSLGHKLDLKLK